MKDFLAAPCFAAYRYPDETVVDVVCSREAVELCGSFDDVPREGGFIAAPFDTREQPQLFIPAKKRARFHEKDLPSEPLPLRWHEESDRPRYMADFKAVKQALAEGRCSKIVLARRVKAELSSGEIDPLRLFGAACKAYPHNYVALWHTPQSGTWLTASPELLLARSARGRCRTMALAGTMAADSPEAQTPSGWSKKNLEEQALVQRHIRSVLRDSGIDFNASGLKIAVSGDLLHLRTDFDFPAPPQATQLLASLHPTPAVCGAPQLQAMRVLSEAEHICREYYAGYSGPVLTDGTFALYVTLRCLHVAPHGCDLFAGGGVLPQSIAGEEWTETERKLNAMRRLMPQA